MKILNTLSCQTALLVCTSLFSGALLAQAPNGGGERPKPPAEAIAACQSLKGGQNCTFSSPQRTVTGNCWAPEGKPLACRPKDGFMAKNQPAKR